MGLQDKINKLFEEKWMQKAFAHKKGSLHRALGVPEGETIPASKVKAAAHGDSPTIKKKAQAAINANPGKYEASVGKRGVNVYPTVKRINDIADLAVEKIEKWIGTDSNEFFQLDDEGKIYAVDADIDDFFERYYNHHEAKLDPEIKKDIEVINKYRDKIIKKIVSSL